MLDGRRLMDLPGDRPAKALCGVDEVPVELSWCVKYNISRETGNVSDEFR